LSGQYSKISPVTSNREIGHEDGAPQAQILDKMQRDHERAASGCKLYIIPASGSYGLNVEAAH
jgi:hypothetical protein